jgi:hypothetical protein
VEVVSHLVFKALGQIALNTVNIFDALFIAILLLLYPTKRLAVFCKGSCYMPQLYFIIYI